MSSTIRKSTVSCELLPSASDAAFQRCVRKVEDTISITPGHQAVSALTKIMRVALSSDPFKDMVPHCAY